MLPDWFITLMTLAIMWWFLKSLVSLMLFRRTMRAIRETINETIWAAKAAAGRDTVENIKNYRKQRDN